MTVTGYSPLDLRTVGQTGGEINLIDVRTAAEFESDYIPGSRNLPLDQLQRDPNAVAARLPRDVVLVCQSGARSQHAAQALVDAGAARVSVLDGGIIAYQEVGGTVHGGGQRWAMERQVRMVAGSLVLGGLLGAKFVHPKLAYLSAGIGGGLVFAAASNTCAMANVLSRMPWNKVENAPTLEGFFNEVPGS